MEFRIADTFTDSLGKLTGKEQTTAKTTAFDLQMNPASPDGLVQDPARTCSAGEALVSSMVRQLVPVAWTSSVSTSGWAVPPRVRSMKSKTSLL